MKLERNKLLDHIQMVRPKGEMTDALIINDMKALELIAQCIAVEHHNRIRVETTAIQAWNISRNFYNRTTIHNRVTMTRRIHDLRCTTE